MCRSVAILAELHLCSQPRAAPRPSPEDLVSRYGFFSQALSFGALGLASLRRFRSIAGFVRRLPISRGLLPPTAEDTL